MLEKIKRLSHKYGPGHFKFAYSIKNVGKMEFLIDNDYIIILFNLPVAIKKV